MTPVESLFLALVVLLLCIALFDLVVGVSNDAVNFLSSAIGAKAGTFRTIMIVASVGVFVGASSSGGMMEVAKRGLFDPGMFTFQDLLFLYVVVMLTDILLLDFFNSMKLPTSTTVSIVFELLGAALAISLMRVIDLDQSVAMWFEYISGEKAIQKVSAIFVSVGAAFVLGWIVQYFMRALLTFDYQRYIKIGGAIFGGLATAIVANFIIIVGLKTSPLQDTQAVMWLATHVWTVVAVVFCIVFGLFVWLASRGIDSFRIITFIGTFALAMAFASNDLVNFVGVPIAGLEAYGFWLESGLGANEFTMEVYNGPAGRSTAHPMLLVLAGLVMVVTLWISKKARNVIKTSVDLSRQDEGLERFSGNDPVRALVRLSSTVSTAIRNALPRSVRETIERRYSMRAPLPKSDLVNPPAFDFVRASVNLTVAAFLIAVGTAMKLPLSTTFVSFMVLMGTSLADRAWNRDSAVYRVSGVVTVIGGWFLTAIAAMTMSGIFGVIVYQLEFVGVGIVILLVGGGIYLTNKFTDNEVKEPTVIELPDEWFSKTADEVRPFLVEKTKDVALQYQTYVRDLVDAVNTEDQKGIRLLSRKLEQALTANFDYRTAIAFQLKRVDVGQLDTGRILLDFYVLEDSILRQLSTAAELSTRHVLNLHQPLDADQKQVLTSFVNLVERVAGLVRSESENDWEQIQDEYKTLEAHVDKAVVSQIQGIVQARYSYRNSQVFLSTLLRNLNAIGIILLMYQPDAKRVLLSAP